MTNHERLQVSETGKTRESLTVDGG